MSPVVAFVAGLACLIVGAEALIRGSSRLAAAFGIPPLIIGLTVVAFGTSAPELAVSLKAAFAGQADIALGNVVGSNTFNVLFILGLSALVVPLRVSQQLLRIDVPLMIAVSGLVFALSLDHLLDRRDGLILVAGLLLYIGFLLIQTRRESAAVRAEYAKEYGDGRISARARAGYAILALAGLALLVLGSRWLVGSAVAFAASLGISELVVGLTVVAAGTSLPEVVTSVVAAIRGERDIAVGNVVGSNLFNILSVLGISAAAAPGGVPVSGTVVGFDMPVMIAAAIACLPMFFTGGVISRTEGAVLLLYYGAWTAYLVLAASRHDALPEFSAVMLGFAVPLTALTLAIVTVQEIRLRRRRAAG